jgi:hypothetical protein
MRRKKKNISKIMQIGPCTCTDSTWDFIVNVSQAITPSTQECKEHLCILYPLTFCRWNVRSHYLWLSALKCHRFLFMHDTIWTIANRPSTQKLDRHLECWKNVSILLLTNQKNRSLLRVWDREISPRGQDSHSRTRLWWVKDTANFAQEVG